MSFSKFSLALLESLFVSCCSPTNFILFWVENFILKLFWFILASFWASMFLSGDFHLVRFWCWPQIWCFLPSLTFLCHLVLCFPVLFWAGAVRFPPWVMGDVPPGCCLLPAEHGMFPSVSVQPPKVTFELIFSWLGKLLTCFVFPEEMTGFLVKNIHSAGIQREGITVLQAEQALKVCRGKLCGRTPGDAVE